MGNFYSDIIIGLLVRFSKCSLSNVEASDAAQNLQFCNTMITISKYNHAINYALLYCLNNYAINVNIFDLI